MNTPAHLVLSVALLNRGERRDAVLPVCVGSLLPDAPIFAFYLWQKLGVGLAEVQVWSEAYFRPAWQDFFDVFNSVPVALVGLAIGRLRSSMWLQLCAGAMLLHFALDLPLHHDDGHRHFFPFAELRVASPVSYWDPAHFGAVGALLETGIVWISALSLWQRYAHRGGRAVLAGLCLLYALVYALFYVPRLLGGF